MWLFLATEVLFFGGLFCAYAVYRSNHPEIFVWAHHFLDKNLGALNTVILIFSSFTVAWAVRAAQLRQRKILQLMLVLTIICAGGFMAVKAVEYSAKWEHGLLWARQYNPAVHDDHEAEPTSHETMSSSADDHGPAADPTNADTEPTPDPLLRDSERTTLPDSAAGPQGLAVQEAETDVEENEHLTEPRNARVFFSIYFLMTGLHGIHVLGGIGAMLWLLFKAGRGDFDSGHFTPVHIVGLYWHLVDLIWIYLFLLLYLIH
ncbi:MAG: cytochrome c oxidase subunit 3 family protein [bacterium]|nr:cytochrome c oxidase subunit 3 family protein [bacterium]